MLRREPKRLRIECIVHRAGKRLEHERSECEPMESGKRREWPVPFTREGARTPAFDLLEFRDNQTHTMRAFQAHRVWLLQQIHYVRRFLLFGCRNLQCRQVPRRMDYSVLLRTLLSLAAVVSGAVSAFRRALQRASVENDRRRRRHLLIQSWHLRCATLPLPKWA